MPTQDLSTSRIGELELPVEALPQSVELPQLQEEPLQIIQFRIDSRPAATQYSTTARQRGLRRFLAKLALFGLMQLILFGAVETYVASFPNPYNQKRDYLAAHAHELQVISVGSSHILNAVDPAAMTQPAVNLAGYSQDLYYDAQLVRYSLDRLPNLKCVVIGLSYLSFEYDMEQSSEAWRTFFYRRYFGTSHRQALLNWDPRNYSVVVNYDKDALVSRLFQGDIEAFRALVEPTGFARNPVPENPAATAADGPRRISAHHTLMHEENLPGNLAVVGDLLAELHHRGIAAVLVTTPVQPEYLAGSDAARLARWNSAVEQLQTQHGVRHLNFLNDDRFTPADFSNSDHLNGAGAAKFSRILSDDLATDRH